MAGFVVFVLIFFFIFGGIPFILVSALAKSRAHADQDRLLRGMANIHASPPVPPYTGRGVAHDRLRPYSGPDVACAICGNFGAGAYWIADGTQIEVLRRFRGMAQEPFMARECQACGAVWPENRP